MAAERGLASPATAAVAAAVLLAPPAHALDWSFSRGISDSITLTDNVRLAPPGEEEWSLVNVLSPRFSANGESARTTVNARYSLRAIADARDSDRNRINHAFSGSLNSELWRERFFVDANASYRQEIISLFEPIGLDDTTDTGNLQDVGNVSVSPYLVNRFGSFATSTLRYRHSRTFRDFSGTSFTNRGSWALDSGSRFGRLSWGLDASWERVEGVGRETATFREASATAGYELTPHLRVSATGGVEDSDFETRRTEEELEGEFWNVSATWVPNRRTTVTASYGERPFTETWSMSISHRRRAAQLSASYSESFTAFPTEAFVGATLEFCDPAVVPNCVPINEEGTIGVLILPVFEDLDEFAFTRTGSAAITFFGQRQRLTLSAFQTKRDFEVTVRETTQTGGSVTWGWDPGTATTFTAGVNYSRNEEEPLGREDDLYAFRAGVTRSIGQDVRASLTYRHQRRDSTEPSGEFRENAVTLAVSASF